MGFFSRFFRRPASAPPSSRDLDNDIRIVEQFSKIMDEPRTGGRLWCSPESELPARKEVVREALQAVDSFVATITDIPGIAEMRQSAEIGDYYLDTFVADEDVDEIERLITVTLATSLQEDNSGYMLKLIFDQPASRGEAFVAAMVLLCKTGSDSPGRDFVSRFLDDLVGIRQKIRVASQERS